MSAGQRSSAVQDSRGTDEANATSSIRHAQVRRERLGSLNKRLRGAMLSMIVLGTLYVACSWTTVGNAVRFVMEKEVAWRPAWYKLNSVFVL